MTNPTTPSVVAEPADERAVVPASKLPLPQLIEYAANVMDWGATAHRLLGNPLSAQEATEFATALRAALATSPAEPAVSDEELGRIAHKGYDDYWTEECPGRELEAWTASAKAVLAVAPPAPVGAETVADVDAIIAAVDGTVGTLEEVRQAVRAALASPARPASTEPSDDEKRKLIGGFFAEDWAVDKAMDLLHDYHRLVATPVQPVPASPPVEVAPVDICTDPSNCNRCKAHPNNRQGLEHAGIGIGIGNHDTPPATAVTEAASLRNSAPRRIYLDIGDQFTLERVLSGGMSWQSLEGVTWSEDNATSHGVEYVRADLATPPAAGAVHGLTDEQIDAACNEIYRIDYDDEPGQYERAIARAVLALSATSTAAVPASDPDGERYRLLRRGQHWSVIDGIGNTLRADELDAAIDARSESDEVKP